MKGMLGILALNSFDALIFAYNNDQNLRPFC
jgi:hypothetical protein